MNKPQIKKQEIPDVEVGKLVEYNTRHNSCDCKDREYREGGSYLDENGNRICKHIQKYRSFEFLWGEVQKDFLNGNLDSSETQVFNHLKEFMAPTVREIRMVRIENASSKEGSKTVVVFRTPTKELSIRTRRKFQWSWEAIEAAAQAISRRYPEHLVLTDRVWVCGVSL